MFHITTNDWRIMAGLFLLWCAFWIGLLAWGFSMHFWATIIGFIAAWVFNWASYKGKRPLG